MNGKILCLNLNSTVEDKGNLYKINWSHFELIIMNEIFNFLEF